MTSRLWHYVTLHKKDVTAAACAVAVVLAAGISASLWWHAYGGTLQAEAAQWFYLNVCPHIADAL